MSDLPIPLTVEDFTPDWVTAALQSSGTLEDERVVAVEANPWARSSASWGRSRGSR